MMSLEPSRYLKARLRENEVATLRCTQTGPLIADVNDLKAERASFSLSVHTEDGIAAFEESLRGFIAAHKKELEVAMGIPLGNYR